MNLPPLRDVTIDALAQTGEGVARVDGRTVLVPGTMPGERVTVRLERRATVAERVALTLASSQRVEPLCPIVDRCGACSWQHVPSEMQRDARIAHVRRALPPSLREHPIAYHPAPSVYAYRSRARLAWHTGRDGTALGFRARNAHEVVDVPRCPVLVPSLDVALSTLHVALGALGGAGEASLALGAGGRPVVTLRPGATPRDARGFGVPQALLDAGFAGAALWPPGASAPTVAGDPRPVAQGGDGSPLFLAPGGFAQANDALNAVLAEQVTTRADASGATVIELYAGAGNFTVSLARTARRVTAVESDRDACIALQANVAARGLQNVTVVTDDAAGFMATRVADVVVLDPPRAGAREACRALVRTKTRRVVYVSCDPPTLGRDLGELATAFDVETLDAFEMFPQTPHVELLVRLDRRRA